MQSPYMKRRLLDRDWRLRWQRGEFPRWYRSDMQPYVDAEFWSHCCARFGAPGGALPVWRRAKRKP